mgnify:CR=1 FL=1
MNSFSTVNPSTEEEIASYQYQSDNELSEHIKKTQAAFLEWRQTTLYHRKSKMLVLAELLKNEKESLGHLITTEMGKPLNQSIAEIEKCAWVCEYFAEKAAHFLTPQNIKTDASESYISYQPTGIIFAIMPWNFPFWQVFRFLSPNLMAGNAGILKHAPNTTACGLKIQELVESAGFPLNLFNTIIIDIPQVENVISNRYISGVTLTGSTNAGKLVAEIAGKHLKKSVLELGGSDPYIILDDADIDLAVKACVAGRVLNSGQSCIAAKRFIVTKKNVKEFTEILTQHLKTKQFGDPLKNPDLGSLARKDLRETVHSQVKKSVDMGATCVLGGYVPEGKGFFYPMTLLTNVSPGMPAFEEEIFGPVAVVIEAKSEEEAIELANQTDYGLGGVVFSRDIKKARYIAETRLEVGSAFVNAFVKSDPRLPFGGIKKSGYGRELAQQGFYEFLNIKTIYIDK